MDKIPSRDKIRIGASVLIVQKQDQRTGNLTEGIVKRILTSSNFHPHGIKVELENGKIGRVQKIH
ncbi:MAG: YwbE family protein [Thermoproteota archaeon]